MLNFLVGMLAGIIIAGCVVMYIIGQYSLKGFGDFHECEKSNESNKLIE